MTKFDKYDEIKNAICGYGYDVGEYREIPYGLQFTIVFKGSQFNIRVYESSKKGITVDYSQVKNHKVKKAIEDMLVGKYENTGYELYKSDNSDLPLIGTDESGKGDYFGALCVSGVYGDKTVKKKLSALGVKDCKKLNDYEVVSLAQQIRKIDGLIHYTLQLYPSELNELTINKNANMNTVLALLHLNVINQIANESNCKLCLIDQFADDSLILDLNAKQFNIPIEIEQRPKAESNIIVAAASILARNSFLESINELSNRVNMSLPTGCGSNVIEKGTRLVEKQGVTSIIDCGKVIFKDTTKTILQNKALVIL